jgi:nucleotide-binding universal stress UspA family protein
VPSFAELSGAVEDALSKDTAAQREQFPGVRVELRAVQANPAKCLVEMSRDAFILVVGSRGLGGFAGMILGSVSEQTVRHAACPVLVVRHGQGPRTDADL